MEQHVRQGLPMAIHAVHPMRSFAWVAGGWRLFASHPWKWMGLLILYIILNIILNIIPAVGQLAMFFLTPVFFAGILLGCQEIEQGGALAISHLFAGFRFRTGKLLWFAIITLLLPFVLILPIMGVPWMADLFLPIVQTPWMAGQAIETLPMLAIILLAAEILILMVMLMAMWFAVPLILETDRPMRQIFWSSLVACGKNWLPLLLYGLLATMLLMLAIIPLGLGLLIVIPMLYGSYFVSFKDIFPSHPSPSPAETRLTTCAREDKPRRSGLVAVIGGFVLLALLGGGYWLSQGGLEQMLGRMLFSAMISGPIKLDPMDPSFQSWSDGKDEIVFNHQPASPHGSLQEGPKDTTRVASTVPLAEPKVPVMPDVGVPPQKPSQGTLPPATKEADFQGGVTAYNRGDLANAVRLFTLAADQGHAQAQFNLGLLYGTGKGVPLDYARASALYRQAAEQGDVLAQYNLAALYSRGQGVPLDLGQTRYWFNKAADQGDIQAQYNLGLMYETGSGTAQNREEAVRWYGKAARQDHPEAKAKVAELSSLMTKPLASPPPTPVLSPSQGKAPQPVSSQYAVPVPIMPQTVSLTSQQRSQLNDQLGEIYQKKVNSPAYVTWESTGGLLGRQPDFPEDATIHRLIAQLAAHPVFPDKTVHAYKIPVKTSPVPTIDGAIRPGEWDQAEKINISLQGEQAILWMQSDGHALYVACDALQDKTPDGFDQFRFYFHVDLSPMVANQRIHIHRNSSSSSIRQTSARWVGEPPASGKERWKTYSISDAGIMKRSFGRSLFLGHRMYEMVIDMEEASLSRNVPWPFFVELESDPFKDDHGKFLERNLLGVLGNQRQPVWLLVGSSS